MKNLSPSVLFWSYFLLCQTALWAAAADRMVYEPKGDTGKGKHIVLLSGDEEYRSEEGLPMLGKILSQRHGFKCTVLFAQDSDGTINPDNTASLPGAEALDSADAIVMLLRFRAWPDNAMNKFADAVKRGVPIIALRTSTHAFNHKSGDYKDYNKFGEKVLGEEWIQHWGRHKAEATRGIIEPAAKDNALLRGVTDIFGDTDVYEAYPPADATILVRGQVLKGMKPTDPPADYKKKRDSDKQEQGINDPMMPVAWTRLHKNEAGKENKVFCTTLGSATDLQSEGLRRLVVNAVYWGLNMEIPAQADVRYVDDFKPTMYGFGGYKRGIKPEDHALGKVLRDAPTKGEPKPKPAQKTSSTGPALKLKKGDGIALIGNALPDRMQHFGYLESLIVAAHPEHDLVIRNLAVAGDEIVTRHRSENFGSPDEWLQKTGADVIFAFFGYNESFKGYEGLEGFKKDLDKFLKETLKKNYSGKGNPRIVLLSPTADESHQDQNFPNPAKNNDNLKDYTAAMAAVAEANGVRFVDLFTPSQALYADAASKGKSLTVNSHLLTEEGDKLLAPIIFRGIFGTAAPNGDSEKLRKAINEKNAQWHARYRTIDGYNVYGGRSKLSFPSGKDKEKITNFHVMQEEMSQRDVLTANRDKRVWAVAKGGDLQVDDSNLPPVTKIPSNKPGSKPDQSHEFLSGEDAIKKMTVHSGMKVNLFASEEQFPELENPVQMAWDTKGRLWVAAWPNYPERTPTSKKGDSLLIFEDTNGDGKADKQTVFIGDLNAPTGFQFYKDGVLLVQAPDVWFIRDTDGDGKADWKERVLMGLDSADSHHTANAVCLEPGGAIYLSDGVFHRTQVETAWGPVRNEDAAIYRFEPTTGKFERYIPYGFANPHGRVFDYWGNDLVTDATGNNTYFGPAFSGLLDYPAKHPNMKQFWERPSRPCPGTGILSSRHFPEEFQGNFLNINVISFQGIYRVHVTDEGSGLKGETKEHLISSSDPNFRPTAVSIGPDGAIYFVDWHNPIIGHMQHHIRDPNRDHEHGRIYRITYEGRPLLKQPPIHGQPIQALLELLKEPENHVRELAKVELGKHDGKKVTAAAKKWAASLDKKDPAYAHHLTEALWVHQWHNLVDLDLLHQVLGSSVPQARAQATRVLCYWGDRVPNALPLIKKMAADIHPRVRLEAVRAASFFRENSAVDAALAALKHPTDYYIDYTLKETIRQLQPVWKKAISEGKPIAADNQAGFQYLTKNLKTSELLNMPKSKAVLQAGLSRSDTTDAARNEILDTLAKDQKTTRTAVLLDLLESSGQSEARQLSRVLPLQVASELKAERARVRRFTGDWHPAELRFAAWAAVIVADNSFDTVWAEAGSPERQFDILSALPAILDSDLRNKAYPKVKPLLERAPTDGIRRAAIQAAASMTEDPKAVFGALTDLLVKGEAVPVAAQGIRTLPRASWPKDKAIVAAKACVDWANKVPNSDRTSQDYLEVVQFASELAGLLPKEEASTLRAQLKELRVPVFVIRTVREQMRYDTPRLVVEAGKPFEIIIENSDFMPHNLVVVNPKSREKIGNKAATMLPDQLDKDGRAFVPKDNDILAATRMLEAGQKATLKLTAPKKEGDYEYVCTYPGHWMIMWGQLIVTEDVDGYLQKHPLPEVGAVTSADHAHAH